ncbi:MAG: glycosyl hydrolase 53 family protein [Firmicutes bacterium]|nr:glycosyl hydrolase 53 family protein [Bacillota bacterium]
MKAKKIMAAAMSAVLLLSILSGCGAAKVEKVKGSDDLYVRKVEGLADDFIMDMDLSSVLAEEASGVKYYGYDGKEQDIFLTLAQSGVTHIRVRVWNDPFDADGNGFGGGNCDIDTAVEIGRRATKYGLKLIVDFHYSDFWADPSKQMVPRAWQGMSIEEKTEAAYQYTKECLEKLKAAKVDVGMVQTGNETNAALAGEKTWFNIQYIMQAGARATREVFPEALVAVHFANPETPDRYRSWASKLEYYEVDYDVFATSYYPYWHGTLDNLAGILSEIAETYDKKVMVMETSYAYTAEDTDFNGNTIGEGGEVKGYPFSVQGQTNCIVDIIDTIANKTKNGIGVVYWEGAWITVGTESWEKNHEIWEKYGSGWASSYASVYDPNDAGKYYGGSAVDNQAMFDSEGHPLESLKLFQLVRTGNAVEIKAEAIETSEVVCDVAQKLELPKTVSAVMTDGSKQEIPVEWDVTQAELDKMQNGGVARYEISGTAGGLKARASVSMVKFNYLKSPSFEEGDEGWTITALQPMDQLYVEDKEGDSLSGTKHLHFWNASGKTVEFTAEQTVEGLQSGTYDFTISIMGGDGGTTDIYAYIKQNGQIIAQEPLEITSWKEWHTAHIRIGVLDGEAGLTVGIYVKCSGAGNGAWGKIDDAILNSAD